MHQAPTDAFASEVTSASGRVLRSWQDGGVFALAEFRGLRHLMAWGPGIGVEHHALVPFGLRSSVLLGLRGNEKGWLAGPDGELARWIASTPALAGLAERLSWKAVLPPGAPPMLLDWVVQLRPVAGGRGHLVLRAGEYGGRTGAMELMGVIEWMSSAIPRADQGEREFLVEPVYGAVARAALELAPAGASASASPPAAGFVPPSGTASARDAGKLVDAMGAVVGTPVAGAPADDREHARRVNEAGRLFLGGDYDAFIAIWESVLRDYSAPDQRAAALHQIGAGHYVKKDYARAIQYYESALAAGHDRKECETDIADARKKMK